MVQITCFVNKWSLEHQHFLKNGKLKDIAFSENSLIFALYEIGQNLNVTILTLIFFKNHFQTKIIKCYDVLIKLELKIKVTDHSKAS